MTDAVDGDDEELERRVAALEATVEELREAASIATNHDIPLLQGAVRAVIAADTETFDDFLGPDVPEPVG